MQDRAVKTANCLEDEGNVFTKTDFTGSLHSKLDILNTEVAIKLVKDTFERELAEALHLIRVSAPLFVRPESGLNDDLNGVERPVQFDVLEMHSDVQVVHSLAKWKRLALKRYGFGPGSGIYTDMNAIRRDEDLDNLHSVYVDQWDWEKVITKSLRNTAYLQDTVKAIVGALRRTQDRACRQFPILNRVIPEKITFLTTQQLEDCYPGFDSQAEGGCRLQRTRTGIFDADRRQAAFRKAS